MKIQYQAKIKCSECKDEAIWLYMPRPNKDSYYCDACVPRGCSCNWIDEQGLDPEEIKDDLGRSLPCCEYDYCEEGFDV